MIKLNDVYEFDGHNEILWELLSEREDHQNISHKEMPSFEQHLNFVAKRPYLAWYILTVGSLPVGAIYLTDQREIGLFIFKEHRRKGYGSEAVKLLCDAHPGPIYANIAPGNAASQAFFDGQGFRHIQQTYLRAA